ncbi:MAG: hypothetical protein UHC59_05340 [Fibrobacteraceae bacterium]|nr:hypothetical protein [Fibrobacteraceae bacterium]
MQKSHTNLFIAKKDLPAILVIAKRAARFLSLQWNLPRDSCHCDGVKRQKQSACQ